MKRRDFIQKLVGVISATYLNFLLM